MVSFLGRTFQNVHFFAPDLEGCCSFGRWRQNVVVKARHATVLIPIISIRRIYCFVFQHSREDVALIIATFLEEPAYNWWNAVWD